jgi:hypothetical protein
MLTYLSDALDGPGRRPTAPPNFAKRRRRHDYPTSNTNDTPVSHGPHSNIANHNYLPLGQPARSRQSTDSVSFLQTHNQSRSHLSNYPQVQDQFLGQIQVHHHHHYHFIGQAQPLTWSTPSTQNAERSTLPPFANDTTYFQPSQRKYIY